MILVDLDAGIEQRAVQRPRRVVQQPIFDTALQQQDHANAARRGFRERVPERQAREKIRARDQNFGRAWPIASR